MSQIQACCKPLAILLQQFDRLHVFLRPLRGEHSDNLVYMLILTTFIEQMLSGADFGTMIRKMNHGWDQSRGMKLDGSFLILTVRHIDKDRNMAMFYCGWLVSLFENLVCLAILTFFGIILSRQTRGPNVCRAV